MVQKSYRRIWKWNEYELVFHGCATVRPLTCTNRKNATTTIRGRIVRRIGNSRITLTASLSLYHLLLYIDIFRDTRNLSKSLESPKKLRVSRIRNFVLSSWFETLKTRIRKTMINQRWSMKNHLYRVTTERLNDIKQK